MTVVRLIIATIFPTLAAVLVYKVGKMPGFSRLSYMLKQIMIGIVFGGVAILATEFGVPVDGIIMNVRSAAPITAGLLFGAPAGIIAGIIGGLERWFCVYWGGSEYTRLACTLATVMAGFFAAGIRKYMFDNGKVSWEAGFAIGITTEVLHMLLIFVTNMKDINTAFYVVEKCAPIMIFLNAIAVALAINIIRKIKKEKKDTRSEKKKITQIFRTGLMFCVVFAFLITYVFTMILQTRISDETAETTLEAGIQEVCQNLREVSENTFLIYAAWIAGDILSDERTDQPYLETVSADYKVSEIFVVNSEGLVISSNIGEAIGNTVSKTLMPPEDEDPEDTDVFVGAYGMSVLYPEKAMQYASIRIAEEDTVIVGYDEETVVYEIQRSMETLATGRHLGQQGFLMIADEDEIIVSNGKGAVDQTLEEAGIDLDDITEDKMDYTIMGSTVVRVICQKLSTPAGMYYVIAIIPEKEVIFARDTSVYNMVFMEILVFLALFINMYFLTKRVVVNNIHKVNNALEKITEGNLDEMVVVRDNEEFASLSDGINSTVSTLKYYIAEAETRIDKELELARNIQYSALPSVFPPYPKRKEFDIYALMDTAKEVGGDFYDFYLLDQDHLGFMIADVSGKGVPAAMFMMTAKTVIKDLAQTGLEVHDILTQANATLCEGNSAGMFVTAWLGILDLSTGILSFANAGHNPPLIRRRDGSFEFLSIHSNFVLAGLKSTRYKKQELILFPGDEIFLYTDGVTEAENLKTQMFGEEKLVETLNSNMDADVEERCQSILRTVEKFAGEAKQFDDITMLSLKVNYLQNSEKIVVYPDAASAGTVWQFIDDQTKNERISKELGIKLKICTDEIYSNLLKYSQASRVEITSYIGERELLLVFCDNGQPYDPTKSDVPDVTLPAKQRNIGGLGIYMVKESVKSLDYTYQEHQNILTLTFEL